MSLERRTGLVFALDLLDKERSFEMIDKIKNYVDAIKINYPFTLSCGMDAVKEIKEKFETQIIADFKIADVSVTNKKILNLCKSNGADAVLVHGFIGPENLIECKKFSGDEMSLFVVTELTNEDPFFDRDTAIQMANMAKSIGVCGVQAPATKLELVKKIREELEDQMQMICCGVGAQGGVPGSAISAGANFEIVGRAIYQSENPAQAAKKISRKTREAIKSRKT